jgi:hypothetical protein
MQLGRGLRGIDVLNAFVKAANISSGTFEDYELQLVTLCYS